MAKKNSMHEQMKAAAEKVLEDKKQPEVKPADKDAKGDSVTARAFRAMRQGW